MEIYTLSDVDQMEGLGIHNVKGIDIYTNKDFLEKYKGLKVEAK